MVRWLLGLIAFFSISGLVQAEVPIEHLNSLSDTKYHRIESERLGRGFHIYVHLPPNYESSDQSYPTIYLLDGGITFPLLTAYHRYLVLSEELPPAILVGISYGSETFEGGNYRGSDFTAPAESRAHYGGASSFLDVMKTALFPAIESDYRADPARRILFGQSLGGQFALFAAQNSPDSFMGLIASNPALHRNLDYFLEQLPDKSDGTLRLYVSSGTEDEDRFRVPALEWIDHWSGKEEVPWALKTESLEGQNHFSPAPEAYRRGLRWIFR